MSDYAEIRRLGKAIQAANESNNTTEIHTLMTLLTKFSATEEILRKTEVGLVVGKLRNHADASVSVAAKNLVRKWKQDVISSSGIKGKPAPTSTASSKATTPSAPDAQPSAPKVAGSTNSSSQNGAATGGTPAPLSATVTPMVSAKASPITSPISATPSRTTTPTAATSTSPPAQPAAAAGPPKKRDVNTDGVKVKPTGDPARDQCTKMLYAALATNSGADSELLLKRAVAIEAFVFQQSGTTNVAYKSKIKSLFLNLGQKSNPGLREAVASGDITIPQICTMSSQDMASEERKAKDRQLQEDNLFKARGAGPMQAETDQFRCGRCKSRKCTYYQMQTRSADEPMTTFVTCTNCENRWKFC
ncbi:transcription elongation factor TFIIS [Dimargaris cristalligena]|uniref:Transcription elongation factor n=1 Tax=Dimargaris cristalligena TaxID=215637 RepID=A0A4Q0A4M1_9FUNG|nr:transcription elongation factor TFIIS [Dimargaris cristalligena]RKP40352.1 transcription factor S-II, central domain-containing protein [Dimargaris cristalligena]|eukprot:RKP40352.1 transcription factor S-II, central domain-containing protein [Dimargaris cristalligena]